MGKNTNKKTRRDVLKLAGGAAAGVFAGKEAAQANVSEPFRMQLALLMDVSHSMDDDEYRIQIGETANALLSKEVKDVVLRNLPMVIGTFQFSSAAGQVGDWHEIYTEDDLNRFALALKSLPREIPRSGTNIARGVSTTIDAMNRSGYKAFRRVIDVSGDGSQEINLPRSAKKVFKPFMDDIRGNIPLFSPLAAMSLTSMDGIDPPLSSPNAENNMALARAKAESNNIRINGLAITVNPDNDVYGYYQKNVKTNGGFVIQANGMDEYAQAIRRKLILEIADAGRFSPESALKRG